MKYKAGSLILFFLFSSSTFADTQLIKKGSAAEENINVLKQYYEKVKGFNLGANTQPRQSSVAEKSSVDSADYKLQGASVAPTNQGLIVDETRDPFAITSMMLSLSKQGDSQLGFKASKDVRIPKLKLKGTVDQGERGIAALIEIDEIGVIVVRVGDTIGLRSSAGQALGEGLMVKSINPRSLVLTAGDIQQNIIIR